MLNRLVKLQKIFWRNFFDSRNLYLPRSNERGNFSHTNFAAYIDSQRNKKCHATFILILCAVCDIGSYDFPRDSSRYTIGNFRRVGINRWDFGGVVRSKFIPRRRVMLRYSFCIRIIYRLEIFYKNFFTY